MPMTDQIRVNIAARVDNSKIRHEKRNGRDVIVVPSATLPDNIIMNGIRYPADEIEASYHTLNKSLAPLGHPTNADGEFLSASEPEGLAGFYIGAWNENARKENGRIMLDKVIDVEIANSLPRGKRVIDAINEGKPIHTSTGLLCNLDDGDGDAKYTARNMYFDHDAILLDEPGAATPDQGVGMLVNKAVTREGKHVDVINSSLSENLDKEIDYLGTELVRAIGRKEDATTWERIKAAIFGALSPTDGRETMKTNSTEDLDMTDVTKEQFDALSAQVNALADGIAKLVEGQEALTEQANAAKAAEEAAKVAAKNAAVEAVVNKGILSKEIAEKLDIDALKALVGNTDAAAGIVNKHDAKADDFGYASGWE